MAYNLDDYDYALPQHLVAQHPDASRDACRLLVLHRTTGAVEHRSFSDVKDYLRPGDLLVVNDTQVVPARLLGRKETGGRVELLVLDPYQDPEAGRREGYTCLVKASKPPRKGMRLRLEETLQVTVLSDPVDGRARVLFHCDDLLDALEKWGRVPLPPYIERDNRAQLHEDRHRYQTVYAHRPGAVAAPTAGLHFTEELLRDLEGAGVRTARLTLHVGYGTFAPIRVRDIREHTMHAEYAEISSQAAEAVRSAQLEGRRVVAVGTTVVRTLEWVAARCGEVRAWSGLCRHYIYPGYRFRVVDAMITNFHLPKTSLILLVSAFAGRERILAAYRQAVERRYRFFSYGDAMLIL
ncbi:S-adenosylmethionine--tRNA ribosyltransferase-isomerase [Desulfacinum hydrothermale DSM 13146]|uniref:S-adenosylmethionine:tRNA ribosyltransferase-isomerase n=1 Tax=Desulfacinum hydrothermale DSM 13146 TaxID=1121390 RepID=A0A1W1X9C5_9BACT|nr:tRNA preQ1(34) S-adenosylmethionine ribosyltransferase-isomerase QueA [Desulfacinum hydrothermale]SMC20443.1 S-adenosylmethionine--tRNA ribosyltransferase-isomerase [Desulfacinum hydrothermale DSM 13146]